MKYDRKDDIEFIKLSRKLKIEANFTCQLCERRGVELNVHHINSYDWDIPGRYDESNLIVLCKNHHEGFHQIYGFGQNTELQFQEYKEMIQVLIKTAEHEMDKSLRVKSLIKMCLDDGYSDGYTA